MKTWETDERDGVRGIVLRTIDREEFELPSSALGSKSTTAKDGTVTKVTTPKDRFLPFQEAGKRVGSKRLYTVLAEKTDGTVIQIPLEAQINNNVAAPDMFIGLQFYIRKGFNIFFDLETGQGAGCPTWDCWAEWNSDFDGFCTEAHRQITQPTKPVGAFDQNATTSSIWG